MYLVYAGEYPVITDDKPSIFLAQPLSYGLLQAIELLAKAQFSGVVYVPWTRDENPQFQSEHTRWCLCHQHGATVIMCWLPDEDSLQQVFADPQLNYWLTSKKLVLGYPESASEKMRSLQLLAAQHTVPVLHTINDMVQRSMEMLHTEAVQ